jgi:hypothetical protein
MARTNLVVIQISVAEQALTFENYVDVVEPIGRDGEGETIVTIDQGKNFGSPAKTTQHTHSLVGDSCIKPFAPLCAKQDRVEFIPDRKTVRVRNTRETDGRCR